MRSFNSNSTAITTDLVNYAAALSQNTSTTNVELLKGMINDAHQYLLQKYFFNEGSYSITTVGNQQAYPLPFNYSKLKTGTVTIGNLKWTPTEILSRAEWDQLNVFPYYADIPSNFFIYNNQFNLWPIPATGSTTLTYTGLAGTLTVGDTITQGTNTGTILTVDTSALTMQVAVNLTDSFSAGAFTTSGGATGTITAASITAGNTITFNYKFRVPNLVFANYSTGTVTMTNGSLAVTGSGTSWLTTFSTNPGSVLLQNLWIQLPYPTGDGNWYQISSIESNTALTLVQPYQGATASGMTYTIGQMPLLLEDFQDLLVYRPLMIYFSTINKDMDKAAEFTRLYEEGIKRMDEYVGTKSLNVNLANRVTQINPNLFYRG